MVRIVVKRVLFIEVSWSTDAIDIGSSSEIIFLPCT